MLYYRILVFIYPAKENIAVLSSLEGRYMGFTPSPLIDANKTYHNKY